MVAEDLITISGPPGSGTTTLAKKLAESLDFEHMSGGDIFRQQAREEGYSLDEYTKLAEDDPEIDKSLDRQLAEVAERHQAGERVPDGNGLILESRLSGWLAGENADLRVWVDAPFDVRAARIEGRVETVEELRAREESEKERYEEYHGIDIEDLSIYDISVDTANFGKESVFGLVETAIRERESVKE